MHRMWLAIAVKADVSMLLVHVHVRDERTDPCVVATSCEGLRWIRSSYEFYLHVRCSDDFTEEETNLNVNANANVKPDMEQKSRNHG